jgi:hypothetical protein
MSVFFRRYMDCGIISGEQAKNQNLSFLHYIRQKFEAQVHLNIKQDKTGISLEYIIAFDLTLILVFCLFSPIRGGSPFFFFQESFLYLQCVLLPVYCQIQILC